MAIGQLVVIVKTIKINCIFVIGNNCSLPIFCLYDKITVLMLGVVLCCSYLYKSMGQVVTQ